MSGFRPTGRSNPGAIAVLLVLLTLLLQGFAFFLGLAFGVAQAFEGDLLVDRLFPLVLDPGQGDFLFDFDRPLGQLSRPTVGEPGGRNAAWPVVPLLTLQDDLAFLALDVLAALGDDFLAFLLGLLLGFGRFLLAFGRKLLDRLGPQFFFPLLPLLLDTGRPVEIMLGLSFGFHRVRVSDCAGREAVIRETINHKAQRIKGEP